MSNMRHLIDLFEKSFHKPDMDTFTHNNKEYDLDTLKKIIKDFPVEDIEVSELVWIFDFDNPLTDDPERIMTADLENPIIVTKSRGKIVVLDGLHRIAKAQIEGVEKLPCKTVTSEQLKDCLI